MVDRELENMEKMRRNRRYSRATVSKAAMQVVASEMGQCDIPKVWPSIMRIEEVVRLRLGLNYGWYITHSRRYKHQLARAVIARLGRMAGLSFPEIAEPFEVTHSTFVWAFRREMPEADELAASLWKQLTT